MLQSTRYDLVRKIDTSRMNVICTGYRTQQMLRGMRLQTMYYVDVFAVHTGLNNFTYLYGSDVVWFNRTRPMQLVEGKTAVGKLSILGGMSVFSFKVSIFKIIFATSVFWKMRKGKKCQEHTKFNSKFLGLLNRVEHCIKDVYVFWSIT